MFASETRPLTSISFLSQVYQLVIWNFITLSSSLSQQRRTRISDIITLSLISTVELSSCFRIPVRSRRIDKLLFWVNKQFALSVITTDTCTRQFSRSKQTREGTNCKQRTSRPIAVQWLSTGDWNWAPGKIKEVANAFLSLTSLIKREHIAKNQVQTYREMMMVRDLRMRSAAPIVRVNWFLAETLFNW